MSEDRERMSSEDKFLGVRTTIVPPEPDSKGSGAAPIDEIEVEVVDDRPEEDQRTPVTSKADDDIELSDDELSQLGSRAQKRIKKLKWEYHEERRAKETSDRLASEAVNYTQNLQGENKRLLRLVQDSQKALTERSKYGAEAALAIAQENYKKAHESGDSEQIMAAQQNLTAAQLAQVAAPNVSQKVIDDWKDQVLIEQRQSSQEQPQEQLYVPEPDSKALEWQEENPWFGTDKEMTSFAYGVHEKLVADEGIDPTSEEYYELINKRMGEVFPTHFGSNVSGSHDSVVVETASRRRASPVVAPAARNNGAIPRKVTLTSTQVSLAKRLGLTPQQYAQQVIKEMS
jgi:hypothetical protein